MDTSCPSGQTWDSLTCSCVDACAAYPLIACPTGWICEQCPSNSSKLKKKECDTANGYISQNDNCVIDGPICSNIVTDSKCKAGGPEQGDMCDS
ncbi:hypothetical protein J6V86_00870 [bacterium]|nr:hypothetical protein [bacterium]